MRKILRRMDEDAPEAGETAERLNAEDGNTVLHEKPTSLLLEGDEEAIDAVARKIRGWSLFSFGKVELPDPRPQVGRRAPFKA